MSARFGRVVLLALLPCLFASCAKPRATEKDCDRIFDRIVELELAERGFRDPALSAIKKRTFRESLESELGQCPGLPLKKGALDCVDRSTSVEHLSHVCLQ